MNQPRDLIPLHLEPYLPPLDPILSQMNPVHHAFTS